MAKCKEGDKSQAKAFLKLLMLGLLMCVLTMAGVLVASAFNHAWGPWGYYHVAGVDYINNSDMYIYPYNANAVAADVSVRGTTSSGGMAPTGWMGAQGRLHHSNGTLLEESTWYYNSSGNTLGIGNHMYWSNAPTSWFYYSHGWTQAWHGTDYWTYTTFRTPNVGF